MAAGRWRGEIKGREIKGIYHVAGQTDGQTRSVAPVHAVTGDEQTSWLIGPDYLLVLDSTIAAIAGAPKSAWHGHLMNACSNLEKIKEKLKDRHLPY